VTQLEFQAKNVKKAVAKACKELNIKATDLKYQINSYGSSGIFGLVGARRAKISVTIPSDHSPASPRRPNRPKKAERSPVSVETEADAPSVSQPSESAPPETTVVSTGPDSAGDTARPSASSVSEAIDLADVSEQGRIFLQRLTDAITPDTAIACTADQNKISYNITDGNPAVLIGKHGQTLEALQYLTEKAVNRKVDQRIIVEVDVAEYQAKRREKLIDQARRMADKAASNGRSVTIGPMSPQDRRIVHLTLKPDARVRTQSIGRGITRKLTIHPKKKRRQPGGRQS